MKVINVRRDRSNCPLLDGHDSVFCAVDDEYCSEEFCPLKNGDIVIRFGQQGVRKTSLNCADIPIGKFWTTVRGFFRRKNKRFEIEVVKGWGWSVGCEGMSFDIVPEMRNSLTGRPIFTLLDGSRFCLAEHCILREKNG